MSYLSMAGKALSVVLDLIADDDKEEKLRVSAKEDDGMSDHIYFDQNGTEYTRGFDGKLEDSMGQKYKD
ncbi:hypothetical protein [Ferrimonas balearica]|uniref:hypothetical protein n=1 Tax=Ferrimonas balearica TaxID=44012 RepID=UPI001C98EDEA|nr:hypothetical protein [Ferrimonas balearica]MBY5992839.1 hypothetical protein [Ferrimonas balearica]